MEGKAVFRRNWDDRTLERIVKQWSLIEIHKVGIFDERTNYAIAVIINKTS